MACTVVGRGEEGPLYDPGSELYYWEGESIASIINGMGKKKRSELALLLLRCNTIPKHVAPISHSIWTVLCNWSMYNFSSHRPVRNDSR